MRAWEIGLMPIGWARFVGVTANLYSDRFVDGAVDPLLSQMINLADALSDNVVDIDRDATSIDGHFWHYCKL